MSKKKKEAVSKILDARKSISIESKMRASEEANKSLKKKYDVAIKVINELEHMREIAEVLDIPRKKKKFRVKARRKGAEGLAILQVSDVHGGEIVEPETVNFLNEYNVEIAERRMQALARNVVKMCNMWRELSPLDDLAIFDEGDAWSGDIHEELKLTTVFTPTESVVWYHDIFDALVYYLVKNGGFKRIHILKKYGNHTRRQKEVFHAAAYRTNDEYMLAKMMEKHNSYDNVTWQIDTGYFSWYDCYGLPIRSHHGNAVGYRGGIGGKVIPIKRAITSKWNKGKKAYLDMFGHFHELEWTSDYVSNGSVIGYSAYSQEKFPYEPPRQVLSIMDKRRGIVAALPIFLDEPKEIDL